ncbi:MAG: hypothetical protein JO250_20570 [Armatimonadetes bacterium]|nr:hypothetical protein [Armatimonadota bacterium]
MGWTTLPLDMGKVLEFLDACLEAGVNYGVTDGNKIPHHGAVPGVDFKHVDCSGFMWEAVWRGIRPAVSTFPDGSVRQHDWVRNHGFEPSSPKAGGLGDGLVRIAFLAPVFRGRTKVKDGHVTLIYLGWTIESHGGRGPDRRAWGSLTWHDATDVYVLADASD